jgi:outer membrane protein assembly factor BamB
MKEETRKFLFSAFVLLMTFSVVVASFLSVEKVNAQEEDSWSMFGNNPARTGSLENQDLVANVSDWEIHWSKPRDNSPAIANGYVYYKLDHVICLNAFTGETVWEATKGVAQDIWSVVIVYGSVYADANGYVYALNASTGEEIWTYEVENDEEFYAPTVSNGVVYVGCGDNNLYAFDAYAGTKIWNYSTSGKVRTSPAVVNGIVYVGSNDGNVYALDASSGTKLWNYSTGNIVQEHYGSSPAVSDGIVYIGSDGSGVYALNASTGAKIWNALPGAIVFKTPVVAYDYVYMGVNNWLFALDASTGMEIWNFSHPGFFPEWASPAVADGVIYIGSGAEDDYYSGNFYVLDAYTGEQIDHIELDDRVYSTPAIAYGTVYLASTNRLYAIDTSPYVSNPDPPSLDDWSEVARFSGSGSEKYTTDYFTCDYEEWRIRWEYVPSSQQPDLTSFSMFTYPKSEGDREATYVNQIMKTGTVDTNGTSFIHNYQGTFHMYIDVEGTESYTIIIEQNLSSIPEFPSWTILPLFLVATFAVVVIRRRLVG